MVKISHLKSCSGLNKHLLPLNGSAFKTIKNTHHKLGFNRHHIIGKRFLGTKTELMMHLKDDHHIIKEELSFRNILIGTSSISSIGGVFGLMAGVWYQSPIGCLVSLGVMITSITLFDRNLKMAMLQASFRDKIERIIFTDHNITVVNLELERVAEEIKSYSKQIMRGIGYSSSIMVGGCAGLFGAILLSSSGLVLLSMGTIISSSTVLMCNLRFLYLLGQYKQNLKRLISMESKYGN